MSRSILDNSTKDEYVSILEDFKNNDIKIIIGIFDITTTVKLFCAIFQKKMYGENYQWIILGSYNQELSRQRLLNIYGLNCTADELLEALNGTLQTRVVQYSYEYVSRQKLYQSASSHQQAANKPSKSLSKLAQLETKYSDLVDLYIASFLAEFNRQPHTNCLYSYFHGYAFDVLLAVYKVLSTLIETANFSCANQGFRRNIKWFNLVNNVFKKISFRGVTVILQKNII